MSASGDSQVRMPELVFAHLTRMTTPMGIWEHALYSEPREANGMCTDDNARALILLLRQSDLSPELRDMADAYLRFVVDAALPDGGFRNRRRSDGMWADTLGSDDSQGRAIWALGTAISHNAGGRSAALDLFARQEFRSPSPRANAFAVLGAVEVLAAAPGHHHAMDRMKAWVGNIVLRSGTEWPWPEARLAYDNARLPEALIAAGSVLDDEPMLKKGIDLLDWLVTTEMQHGHFSFTPVGGWAPGEDRPGFDQQPVEAAAFADACARAWDITGTEKWRRLVELAALWFLGENDGGALLYDPETGGGYDGLTPSGANLNQGAESTIAALSTLQRAAKLAQ
jgi:hypothetical protein